MASPSPSALRTAVCVIDDALKYGKAGVDGRMFFSDVILALSAQGHMPAHTLAQTLAYPLARAVDRQRAGSGSSGGGSTDVSEGGDDDDDDDEEEEEEAEEEEERRRRVGGRRGHGRARMRGKGKVRVTTRAVSPSWARPRVPDAGRRAAGSAEVGGSVEWERGLRSGAHAPAERVNARAAMPARTGGDAAAVSPRAGRRADAAAVPTNSPPKGATIVKVQVALPDTLDEHERAAAHSPLLGTYRLRISKPPAAVSLDDLRNCIVARLMQLAAIAASAAGAESTPAHLLTSLQAGMTLFYDDGSGDRVRLDMDDDVGMAVRDDNQLHLTACLPMLAPGVCWPGLETLQTSGDATARADQACSAAPVVETDSPRVVAHTESIGSADSYPGMEQESPVRAILAAHNSSESLPSGWCEEERSPSAPPVRGTRHRHVQNWMKGKIIGSGSYGRVFAGIDLDSGQPIALKEVGISVETLRSASSVDGSEVPTGLESASTPASGIRSPSRANSIVGVDIGAGLLDRLSKLDHRVRALRKEIDLLSRCRHRNIIQYLGMTIVQADAGDARSPSRAASGPASSPVPGSKSGPGSATVTIFLEFASGGSLRSLLSGYGALPERLVARYARDILEGLQYLHARGILHRDVKPANVLLEQGVAKLADFGCSKLVPIAKQTMATHGEDGGSTAEGADALEHTMVGTVVYAAPEILGAALQAESRHSTPELAQERGRSKAGAHKELRAAYGAAADIWSVGMTCLEMLSGCVPWKSAANAVYKLCMTSEIPELPELLSEPARDFLISCLVRDPAARPTADDLLQHPFVVAVANSDAIGLDTDGEDDEADASSVADDTTSVATPSVASRRPSEAHSPAAHFSHSPVRRVVTAEQSTQSHAGISAAAVPDALDAAISAHKHGGAKPMVSPSERRPSGTAVGDHRASAPILARMPPTSPITLATGRPAVSPVRPPRPGDRQFAPEHASAVQVHEPRYGSGSPHRGSCPELPMVAGVSPAARRTSLASAGHGAVASPKSSAAYQGDPSTPSAARVSQLHAAAITSIAPRPAITAPAVRDLAGAKPSLAPAPGVATPNHLEGPISSSAMSTASGVIALRWKPLPIGVSAGMSSPTNSRTGGHATAGPAAASIDDILVHDVAAAAVSSAGLSGVTRRRAVSVPDAHVPRDGAGRSQLADTASSRRASAVGALTGSSLLSPTGTASADSDDLSLSESSLNVATATWQREYLDQLRREARAM